MNIARPAIGAVSARYVNPPRSILRPSTTHENNLDGVRAPIARNEFRLLKHCGRDGGSGGRGGYLKKSLDRNTTGPLASTGPSKNLRDARSSIASRSRTN